MLLAVWYILVTRLRLVMARDDTLFDSMNLYAKLADDGKVELSGTVFYWNHIDGDTQQTTIIENFPDIDACLEWLRSGDKADYIASML